MNRKKYYIVLTLTALFGLSLSWVLLPTNSDTALMYWYDKQFERSYEHYRKLYEQGDHSINVVIPLVNLMQEYAQIDLALDLLEEYSEEHPNSIDSLKYLAKVYKKANRSYEYLRTLEEIYAIQPSVDVLREKEKYYGYVGDHEREVEALEAIIRQYRPKQGEYLELAYQYAAMGNNAKAMETIQHFLHATSVNKLDISTVTFAIDILSTQNEANQAYRLARDFYSIHPYNEIAQTLIFALQDGMLYNQALDFLNDLPKVDQELPPMIAARVNVYLLSNESTHAFELLKDYLKRGILPVTMYKNLFALAIQYQEIDVIEDLIKRYYINDIPQTLLMKALLVAALSDKQEMIRSFTEILPDDFLKQHEALALALTVVDPTLNLDEKHFLLSHYSFDTMSNHELVVLSKMLQIVGSQKTLKLVLAELDSLKGIPYDELFDVSQLYMNHQMVSKGWELIEKVKNENPRIVEYQHIWLVLTSAIGRQDLIEEWLFSEENLDPDILRDMFYASYEQRHASLAMLLANNLRNLRATIENQKILAEALILNGYTEWAYEIVRELLGKGYDVAELYVNTLIVLSSEKPKYSDHLKMAVDGFFKHNIISDSAWRNLGWLMYEHQKQSLAATVFAQLANGKTINDSDMNTLLWIWGKEITEDQKKWILTHALTSKGLEKSKWIQYFVEIEQPILAMQIVGKDDWNEEQIADKYIEALVMAKQEEELQEVLAYLIPQESRIPRLKKFGSIAYGEGLRSIAESIFSRVLEQDPEDQIALMTLGEIYYGKGEYSVALPYLLKIRENFLANYYIAEIFQIKGFVGLANDYYHCAYNLYCLLQTPTDDQFAVRSMILYRMGYYSHSLKSFEKLLIKDPENQYWRADYANILIDLGYLSEARSVLWKRTEKEPSETLLLARVRYLSSALCYFQALCLSNELLVLYPCSARVRAERSSLEWNLNHWRKAFCYNRQARSIDPENEIYCLAQNEIMRTHRPELMVSGEYRVTGEFQKERYAYFSYRHSINASNQLFARIDFDDIHIEDYVNPNTGVLEDIETVRYKGELSWICRLWSGGVLTPSFYFSEKDFGGGIHYVQPDLRGSTLLALEYNRPNWDFTQTIIDFGTRDMVAVRRLQPLFPSFEVSVGGGLNRYNLEGLENAATSWSLEGSATYLLSKLNCLRRMLGKEGVLSFNYYLDAEYKLSVKEKKGPLEQPYTPLPLVSRETHSAFIFMAKRFGKFLAIDGFGGMSYDREVRGSAVPIWGSQIFIGDLDRFHARFEYSHSTSTEFSNENVDRYMLDFRWLW